MGARPDATEEPAMKILIRFAPFIVFTVLERAAGWRFGVLAGLATLLVVIATSKPPRLGVLNGAMLTFFGAAGALALVAPGTGLGDYLHAIAAGWLFAVAGFALARCYPFTIDIARAHVTPEVAASPQFYAVNRAISGRWVAAFGAMAAASALGQAVGRPLLGTLVTIAAVVAAVEYSEKAPGRLAPEPAAASPAA
jgi:hypothetical protein